MIERHNTNDMEHQMNDLARFCVKKLLRMLLQDAVDRGAISQHKFDVDAGLFKMNQALTVMQFVELVIRHYVDGVRYANAMSERASADHLYDDAEFNRKTNEVFKGLLDEINREDEARRRNQI